MTTAEREFAVEVDGLCRNYGTFEAVRGVSFRIWEGELFALLGTNGAGKTTTIEVLEGLRPPTSGSVRVLGMNPIRNRGSIRPRTGVMLQDGGVTGSLTVRETVNIWRSLTPRARPTAEVLDLLELNGRASVPVEQLSGGERRRLELALAVLGRPGLLFLDEPTTGMDAVSRRKTWEVIRELKRQGATVLLTTHYLEEAEILADRVAIMHAGRIVTAGEPAEVVARLPAQISFRLPDSALPAPDLPGASPEIDGSQVRYRTRRLQGDLKDLLSWAEGCRLELLELTARPASLEDAFIDIAQDESGDARRSQEVER